ncbi:hypothetical protein ABID14_000429 [Peptoniphilus olsenii]|uniref:ABC transporter permease n=1 Tax=Peptoniphilus olsenii TaxID=411570 RepID=A0ABV2JAK1_9FIRM
MKNLVKAELFKLKKSNTFLLITLLNLVSIFYGAGIKFGWSFVSFKGQFDIYRYVFSIWQLYFILGVPMIILMYAGSKILGDEILKGQIILEVAPVANRKKLICGKFKAMIYTTLFYFLTNIAFNILAYILFVKGTDYAVSGNLFTKDNFEILVQILFGFLEIYFLVILAMSVSVDKGAIIGTLSSIGVYVITSLLTRAKGIDKFIIGYFNLKAPNIINIENILIQLVIFLICISSIIYFSIQKFSRKDL